MAKKASIGGKRLIGLTAIFSTATAKLALPQETE